jgi:hypothetical protein
VVEIEHRRLRAFEEDRLARVERALDERGRVGDVRGEALRELEVLLLDDALLDR